MAKRKKKYDDDDGRVITSMNVEGMPWYTSRHTETISEQEQDTGEDSDKPEYYVEEKLTPEESRALIFGSMRAGCVMGLIMAGTVTIAGVIAFLVLGGYLW